MSLKKKLQFGFLGIALAGLTVGTLSLLVKPNAIPAQFSFFDAYDQVASLTASRDRLFAMGSDGNTFFRCGPASASPNHANSPAATFSSSQPITTLTDLSPRPASDLPGIVKLEPERDISETEVATGHCSATRINKNWFVTAAHCITNDYDRLVLKAGSEQLSSASTHRIEADYAVCHGEFKGTRTGFANDLALIHVNNADLPNLSDVPIVSWGQTHSHFSSQTYSSARVGGWGLIEFGGELADFLVKEELDVHEIRADRIRLTSRYGRGPCIGDSGGPLMIEDDGKPVMMGVLSTLGANPDGRICTGSYLANYTNLSAHRDWILATIADCETNSAFCRRF
ncbi:MAG: hypothetical protein CMK09_18400 [Ponticaulis sp.]|nr:hypothetical protein [Ponticaulis sp.]|tara:strand:+ start:52350 stop:53372 length:1023 start_codon:yes stop_codon:yes gene_type:complete